MLSKVSSLIGNQNQNYLNTIKRNIRNYRKYCQRMSIDEDSLINNLTLNQFPWRSTDLSLNDIKVVTKQLGYAPRNIIEIGAYLTKNTPTSPLVEKHPQVAIVYPLNYNKLKGHNYDIPGGLKPFPTVTWMTCPLLQKQISQLEDAGWINKLQIRLNSDDKYLQQMRQAHERYCAFRMSLLTDEDRVYVASQGWLVCIE